MSSRRKSKQSRNLADRPGARPPAKGPASARPRDTLAPARSWPAKLAAFLAAALLAGAAVWGLLHWLGPRREPVRVVVNKPDPVAAFAAETAARDKPVFAQYAGSASCRECHAAEFDKWAASHHGLAERKPVPAIDRPAFDPPRSFAHGSQTTDVRAAGDRLEVICDGFAGKRQAYPVERVIGEDPLRQCLVPHADGQGRLQTLEATWDPRKKEWFNVYGNEDRKPGEWGHWTGRGMNWNSMCAACHNTRVRKNYDEHTDAYATGMAELTVSCEACHGPMKAHGDWQREYRSKQPPTTATAATSIAPPARQKTGDPTIKKISRGRHFDTCGTCHARRGELTGDFVPGDLFHDHHSLVIPDNSDIFYPDGQIRDEDYEFTSFLSSRMHAGGVRCVDCHDPHAGKPVLKDNGLCMKCHTGAFPNAPVIDPAAHSFHKPDSTGSLCVNCHMPQTVYMQRHWRHDHSFSIPDPLLTKQFGIPNACNRCHQDKDVDYALDAVNKWYGPRMERPSRARAQWMARAKRSDPAARDPLIQVMKEERITFWRAVAAGFLGNYLGQPGVEAALIEACAHRDPLVRENAARSLEPLIGDSHAREALTKLLSDPVRNVRVRAAWALRESVDLSTGAGADLLAYAKYNQDQPGGAMQMGQLLLARRDVDAAAAWFARAVDWDAFSAPLRERLAVARSMQGRPADAVEQLERAVKLAPDMGEYWYSLGLAYNEARRPREALAALRKATEVTPGLGRAWYNLGLAYSGANQPAAAIAALQRAEAASPADPEPPYALATIYARLGRADDARAAAARALKANPRYTPAAQLLQALGG